MTIKGLIEHLQCYPEDALCCGTFWLAEPEIQAVMTAIRCAIGKLCVRVLRDAGRIRAALVPSANPPTSVYP